MNSDLSDSPETLKLGQIWRLFATCDLEILRMTFKNNRAPFFIPIQALCIISKPLADLDLSYSPETLKLGHIWRFFASCDLEILQMTLKNDRATLLYPLKLYASFHSHWWVHVWVTVRKRSNWVKFDDFLPSVSLKFYEWPWKTIGHLS